MDDAVAHTVLVVDDDADVRDALRDALERGRYHVLLAHHGGDALTILRSVQIDLIVLDLWMPEVSGWAFLDHRQRDSALAEIPVVVVSALRDLAAVEQDARVAAVLRKPFQTNDLLRLVMRHCPRHRAMPRRRSLV
jgi:two-component system response regulator MprA